MPTTQLSQDIDDKILWFITKIDTDYEGAMAIMKLLINSLAHFRKILLWRYSKRRPRGNYLKKGLNPDLLKKIYQNIDLELINTKLTSQYY